jgi:flagellar M-ring protein FliF
MEMVKGESVMMQARGFYGLPLVRQLGLMAGLAASVALGVAAVLWSQTPDYRLLYSNLSAQDASAVVESLEKSGIKYSLSDASGTVMVPESQVHEARLKLAGEGLPHGNGSGFELLDRDKGGFGVSQFMENARYQRALEGELVTTITSINAVRSARVHLAIPKQTAFARNQKRPTASVMVDLYPGRTLNDAQAAAIGHMVAASIPNLDADQVTIVDQNGRLLTGRQGDEEMRLSSTQFEYRRQLEESYIRRIEDILTPIIGAGAVKAQVNADIDFTVTEQTQESFTPDERAVRSEQLVEETVSGARAPYGVPGALSNQAPVSGNEVGTTETGGSSSSRKVRNYELDKTISHSRMSGGTVRRLTAAVVIDHRTTVGEDGVAVRGSLSDQEIERLTQLVREAIGFNSERGDSVNVVSAAFTQASIEAPEPPPSMLSNFDVWAVGKQLLTIGLVIFLVLGVLRPVLRELAHKGKTVAVPAMPGSVNANGAVALAEDQLTLGAPAKNNALPAPQQPMTFEEKLSAVRALAAQDPKRVAQVVRNWVTAE